MDHGVFYMCEAFQTTKQAFGGLDIVVNNAGIGDEENWEKTVAINLNGLIQGSYLAMEHMRTDEGGQGGLIINIASTAGLVACPLITAYTGTKYAVVGFTRSLAETFPVDSVGVRVACLCPSFAKTDLYERTKISNRNILTGALRDAAERLDKIIAKTGEMEVLDVSTAFMRLVDDNQAHGAVMAVTPAGQNYLFPRHLKGKL